MLGRMIIGGQSTLGSSPPPSGSPDYVVTSDAEWDAVFANSAATLAGKTIEIASANFTQRTIDGRDMWAAGGRLTLRSRDASSAIPSLVLNGVVRGIDFSGFNFQMTGWPANYSACCVFNNGTFGKIRFLNGTTFRHGYGASLSDFDTEATLPEYERIDNVRTATTASATYPLTWKQPGLSITSAWIEFFNRGTSSVRVAIGGAGVVATGTSQLVAAGARFRYNSLNPTTDTHFAVLATAGTSVVNARTEIGLSNYLIAPISQSGAGTVEDVEFRNCLFRDLNNGLKGLRPTQTLVAMDCDFDRIYQDIISLAPLPGIPTYFLRNLECLPFSRSGIAEGLDGDARDPHGDQLQMFENSGIGAIGPVYYAGNRIRQTPKRAGATSQGIFLSDNDVDPSYTSIYLISTMQTGGSGRGLSLGEAGTPYKVRDAYVYGATIVDGANLASVGPAITIDHDGDGTVYVGKSLATGFTVTDQPWANDGNLVGISPAIFPNIANLEAASNRAEIEAALSTTGAGAGIGAVATAGAVDWSTDDHTAVILWQNLPSGAHWNDLTSQAPSTLITLPLRKILNRRASQTISVAAGTEWRKVAVDGVTELLAWGSQSGTIEPDQFVQIRRISGLGAVSVVASITINGFVQNVSILSANIPATSLLQGSPVSYFADPANVPAATSRMTFHGTFNFASIVNGMKPFAQTSTGCDLNILSSGAVSTTVEDSTGAAVLLNQFFTPSSAITPGVWYDITFDVNHAAQTATLTLNGVVYSLPFNIPGTGSFQSNRQISFLATSSGGSALPTGTRAADLSVSLNGILHKAIPNAANVANADPWKRGGSFSNSSS